MAKSKPKSDTKKPPAKKPVPAGKPKGKRPPAKKSGKFDWAAPDVLAAFDRESSRIAAEKEAQIEALKKQWDKDKGASLASKNTYEQARIELQELVKEREQGRGKPPTATGNLFAGIEEPEAVKDIQKKMAATEKENADLRKRLAEQEETAAANRVNAATARQVVNEVADSTKLPEDSPGKDKNKKDGWFPDDLWKRVPLSKFMDFGLSKKDIEIMNSGDMKEGRSAFPMTRYGDVTQYTTPTGLNAYQRRLTDLKGFGQAGYDRWVAAETAFWDWWNNKGGQEAFAKQAGFSPDKTATPGTTPGPKLHAAEEPPAAVDPALRGGGAKPAAEAKPKKTKKADATTEGGGTGDEEPAPDGDDGQAGGNRGRARGKGRKSGPGPVGPVGTPATGSDAEGVPERTDGDGFPYADEDFPPDGEREAE